MRKFDTLVACFPDTYSLMGQDEVSKTYSFPKSYISYRKPRAVSTEQRERARQMMNERNKERENSAKLTSKLSCYRNGDTFFHLFLYRNHEPFYNKLILQGKK